MLYADEPCCGCVPRPAVTSEPHQIAQRPVQRVEQVNDPLIADESDADNPAR